MKKISDGELLFISKSNQEKLKNFSDGASLTARAAASIQEIQLKIANDRLKLAKQLLKDASSAIGSDKTLTRTAVSRAYYAMYHAVRAATYISYGGDDHEQHSVLPTKIPADFPNCDKWKIALKDARLDRNRADYDPYPVGHADFNEIANRLIGEAKILIKVSQAYLKSKS